MDFLLEKGIKTHDEIESLINRFDLNSDAQDIIGSLK
jgi:hypothetical protein